MEEMARKLLQLLVISGVLQELSCAKKDKVPATEVTVKDGENVTFYCTGDFSKNSTTIWSKGNEEIQNNTKYRVDNNVLEINKVTYSDRGEFNCQISSGNETSNKMFILRVRDPYGAVWPTVGIFIQALVLAAILGIHEKCKPSKLSVPSEQTPLIS